MDARAKLAALGRGRLAAADVFPLSSVQQRLWLSDQALPGMPAYHLVRVLDLDGEPDAGALSAALSMIVSRHEALRTSVIAVGGQPLQRVAPPVEVELPVLDTTDTAADDLASAAARRPLDLGNGPLWRAELHRLGARRHRLVLVFHHIIADAATITMLLAELASIYRAVHDGEATDLPPAVAYRSYVAWERSFATNPDRARQVEYWARQLAGREPLDLPTDLPRPMTARRPGMFVPVRVPAAVADALRALARANGATLAQLALAGYAVVLHRYGGRSDIVVGMPVSTRHDPQWTYSAGLYVTTLPIRIELTGNPPFVDLLRQVRGTVLAALGATDVPLEQVAQSGGPLYDVTFSLVRGTTPALVLPGLATRLRHVYAGRAKFDLHVEFTDDGPDTDLSGNLEYDTELFAAGSAQRLAAGIVTLLGALAVDPTRRIGSLPLWSSVDPHAPTAGDAPTAGGGGPGPADAGRRVDQLFADVALARPDRVALVDAADGSQLSYAQLAARAAGVATALAAHGVRRGDFVGITLKRSADMVIAVLGVLMSGAAYVPLDDGHSVRQLAEMVRRSGVRLVIGAPRADLPAPVIGLPDGTAPASIAPAGAAPASAAPANAAPAGVAGTGDGASGDPAYIMFTSGSTGEPKAVMVPHRAIVRLVRGAGFATMTDAERWLHAAAPAFDAATLELWAPLLNGGTVVVLPGLPSVAVLGETIRRHRITSAFLTTGLFNLVVDTDVEALRPLRQLVIGGEAASAEHVRRALRVVGTVVNGYGPTENTTFTACHRMHDPTDVPSPVPLGTPINGTSVHVVDAYGNPVPAGVTGEILAGGLGLAIGYAGAPSLTAERFVPSPFGPPGARLYRTGDYGRIGADGVVQFVGRRDDQVKVRGFRIELGAIERAVATHPEIAQAAVIAHADPSGDRRLVGYVVGGADGPTLSRYLADLLPSYMIPGQWIHLDQLPLGRTGKVDRRALPVPQARSVRAARPNTVVEELLVAWYTELLALADVTPETDFFAVGGHSLLASRLAARIRAVLGVDVPLATVFANPRLADLAVAVAALERTGIPPLRPGGGHERLPLSYAQERLWFLQRYAPASGQYNVPIAIDLVGGLDEATLVDAVQALSDRHPMLRVVFGEHDGEPYQTIRPAGTPIVVRRADLGLLDEGVRSTALDQLAGALFAEPLDLTAGPPLRAALLRMGAGHHRLLLVVHHLVADGWSLPLLCRDLSRAYQGELPPTEELTYGDFAAWQRAALAGPATERLTGYWRDRLAGVAPRLELDGDVAAVVGGAGEEGPGGICRLTVTAEVAAHLRETGRRTGATPFVTLLAAFAVLLTRHTQQRDLVVGTPVAGRNDIALSDMVGLFLNTLPLRVDASGEPTFTELIRRVRETVVGALEHADLPFERIVELVDPPRAGGHQPLAQVLFALQPAIQRRFTLGAVQAEILPAHHGTAKFDLTMSLFDDDEGFSGFLEYRTDMFTPAWAAGFVAEFTELLGRLTGEPDRPAGATAGTGSPLARAATGGVDGSGVDSGDVDSGGAVPGCDVPGGAATGKAPPVGPASDTATTDTAATAAQIGQLWSRLLGDADVDAGTNFFAIGGHSLAAMRVIAHLREEFGRDVPLRDLFDHPVLAAFADRVAAAPRVTDRPPLRSSAVAGPAPLTAAQERHWVLDQLEPGSAAQNVPVVLRLRGPLELAAIERALTLLAVRQAVLRTTFETSGGVPAQRVGSPVPITVPVTDVTGADLDDAIRRDADRPFELTAGPPWRVAVLRLAPDEHYLVLTLHHIICDGWSLSVLIAELAACYPGGPPAPPLPVQYVDYARWQRQWLPDSDRSGYWRRQLGGVPDLELPTDRPRPARPGHRGGAVEIVIGAANRARLESLAAAEGATLFTAVLGVFATLLGRYSGQADFAVGTFHANRDDVAIERLVGFFVNNLALRCDLSGRPTWRSLIRRLRDVVTGAYSHVDTPFEQVVTELGVARSARQTPLFQAMCVLQNLPALPGRIGPLDVAIVRRPYERADYDITLWLREDGAGGLCGGLNYDAELFTEQTVTRLARLFDELVDACLSTPNGPIVDAARTRAADRPHATSRAATRAREPLVRRFAAQAAATPAAVALTWPTGQSSTASDARGAGQTSTAGGARGAGQTSTPGDARGAGETSTAVMTYAELAAAAGRLAARLRERGVGPESRVGVYLGRSAAAVVAFLGVAQAGGAYVPIDPGYPPKRVADLLADAQLGWLVTTALRDVGEAVRDQVARCGVEILPIDDLVAQGSAPAAPTDPAASTLAPTEPAATTSTSAEPAATASTSTEPAAAACASTGLAAAALATSDPSAAGPENLAYAIFTSGSTGRPKPVLVSNENLAAYLDSIMPALALRPTDRVLAFAATTFDATTEELYPALLCGASVALRPADVLVPDAAFDALLSATRPTVLSLPVTFWHAWVDRLAREGGQVPEYLRMLLLNAEEPSVHRYRQWCAAGGAGVRFINTYGPTEATVTASLYEPGPGTTAHELWGRFPIGTALDGVTTRVLDATGRPMPDGAVGELCLGGAGVTRGYGGQPGLTAAAYWPDSDAARPGARLYRTGDLVRRLGDGTLLMLGRADRQVKIRGHRVELGEVEAALLGHAQVAQAAVLDTGEGELRQLVAYLAVTDAGLAGARLRDWLAERLPNYLVPARLLILPALPLNPNGKVDRRALAARLAGDLAAYPPEGDPAAAPPQTASERRLHAIWCAVLGRPDVGVHDNFFGIGGDSIRGLQVVTQARAAGLALTVRDLLERQTIAALAALADARPPTGPPAEAAAAAELPAPAGPAPRATGLTERQLGSALARLERG